MIRVRKIIAAFSALHLVGLFGIGAAVWLTLDHARLTWRAEIVTFKLLGGLPTEDWLSVARRINPLFLGKPDEFEGMRLDAVNAYGKHNAGGAELFQHRCAACHAAGGRVHTGTTAAGETGSARVDFSNPQLQASLSDLDIYRAVTRGIDGTNMPPSRVSVAEGLQLTAYVRSLGAESRPLQGRMEDPPAANCKKCKDIEVTTRDVVHSTARGEWLSYSGNYSGQRFSQLEQIDGANVSRLRPRFVYQLKSLAGLQVTPLVKNGVMFLTGPANEVVAVDLGTGETLWTYERTVPAGVLLCCGRPNRGVALLGSRVFHNTLDAHLIALDVGNGHRVWDVTVADIQDGYSMTGAPLAIDGAIVVGVAGGDFGARGFIDAYDPETGKRLWRFETVPGPGQPGHESWENDAWKTGGGATWVTGTYDPDMDLVYWGVGNPGPEFNPGARPGDNLYTASVVALDAKTGALRWHYQFTPNDGNDWDACQVPVLVDFDYQGCQRKAMLFANRNCFFYVLDRETGKFLGAYPLCEQNWNEGFTAEGRPIRRPGSIASANGALVSPGVTGGPNWPPPAYNPLTELLYVKNYNKAQRVYSKAQEHVKGRLFLGGWAAGAKESGMILTAINSRTGEIAWNRTLHQTDGQSDKSGVLTTASGLIFTGDSEGKLLALDANSGDEIWHYRMGGQMAMPPITYLYKGEQEVAVISGGSLFVLGLVD